MQDKLASKEQKILQIDRDRHNLRNQIKEKDDEIRSIMKAQVQVNKDKTQGKAFIEQKLIKSENELKKSQLQITKLQDQLKRQMG